MSLDVPGVLRWCVLSSGEQRKCADMAVAFHNKGLTPNIQCVYGDSVDDCMGKVKVTDVKLQRRSVIITSDRDPENRQQV